MSGARSGGPLDEAGFRLRHLSRAECLELLAQHRVGRLALTVRALPHLLPVAYECLDGDIVFCVDDSAEVEAALGDAVVAFSIDDFGEGNTSYRIHVTGVTRLEPASDGLGRSCPVPGTSDEDAEFPASEPGGSEPLALRRLAWGRGGFSRVARLHPELITGELRPDPSPSTDPRHSLGPPQLGPSRR